MEPNFSLLMHLNNDELLELWLLNLVLNVRSSVTLKIGWVLEGWEGDFMLTM